MLQKRIVVLMLLYFVISARSFSQKNEQLQVFTIDKNPVMVDEFVYIYQKNNQNKKTEFTKEKIEEYFQLFVNYKLKVHEAKKRGYDTTAAFRNEYNSYRDELRKPYLPDTKVIDSLVKVTYDRLKEEINASHILINLKPDASPQDTLQAYEKISEIRKKAERGEDFSVLASLHSEEPAAKTTKGNLGYFTALQMVFPFEQAAYNTPVGKVSPVIRTRFGYHIVKVNDRRPARGEVEVSHIMLRLGEGADNNKAKNTIFDIYDQLQKGVPWNELCKQYSEDVNSKDNGGKLRPFGVGVMAGVPEFEQMAFALKQPGEISDPFQTQFGWHIIKLESKIPLPPYEELAASLKNRVSRDERVQISKQALKTRMLNEFGFKENVTAKSNVFAMADSSLLKGKWNPSFNSELARATLFKLNDKDYTILEFIDYIKKKNSPGSTSPAQYIEQRYNAFVDEVQMNALEQRIISKSPDYKWLLQEYYEGILLFEIMEKEVWNKASEDSVGQVKYFNTHAANYKAGERMKGKIYSSNNKAQIDQLHGLLQQRDSVAISDFVAGQKVRYENGPFEKQDRPVLNKVTWAKGIYSADNNGFYYVVVIDDILPPGNKTFSEARAAVISDYQNYLEKTWVDSLKKKYSVRVNKKGKQRAFDQLLANH